jgi:hypothetical protein
VWVIVLLDGVNNFTLCGPYDTAEECSAAMNMRNLGTKHGGMYFYELRNINDETVPANEERRVDEPAEHPA